MNIAILTAALNEGRTLSAVFKSVAERYDLFVVDDGSNDETAAVARDLGAKVIRHCINLGQGYAFITGIKAILGSTESNYDYIIFLDADGQHELSEVPRFIEKAKSENLDVIVGSRILGSNYKNAPFLRRSFLPFYTFIINALTGYQMTDAMCGFRAFNVAALRPILHIFDQMLEPQYLASEMFIRFSNADLKVGEVPINLKERNIGQSYKGTLRYGVGVLKAIIRTMMDKAG